MRFRKVDGHMPVLRYVLLPCWGAIVHVYLIRIAPRRRRPRAGDDLRGSPDRAGRDHDGLAALLQQLVDRARGDHTLSVDVTFADIGTLLVRLARPLPGRLPADVDGELAHRHLDLFVEGIRAAAGRRTPAGPRLERKYLHALRRLS
jgi:hypothetical protein